MKNFILLLIPIFFFASCKTLVPFTTELKQENDWSENELKQIQFYLSNSITLHRQLNESQTAIVSGKIKTVNGKKVEEIYIKKGTPGVVTKMSGFNVLGKKSMGVSFEIDDSHFLTFGSYEKRGGKYFLMLREFKKGKWAKVSYVDTEFYISPESLSAFLQINMKKIQKEERKQRVAGGRKL